MADNPSDLLTPNEVAELLRVHPATVTRWIRLGLIEAMRLPGGTYRIPRSELERLREVATHLIRLVASPHGGTAPSVRPSESET
jgi:excisionase family DNA binding protein